MEATPDILRFCAEFCVASYNEKAMSFVTVNDLRYGVRTKNDITYIGFRGTDNFENLIRDASIFPKRSCGGYLAHSGCVNAYKELCKTGLVRIADQSKKIVVAGHSFGGGQATLFAEHLSTLGIDYLLVTFGSMIVYFRWSSAPKLNHLRFVNDDDPVPYMPGINYSHRDEAIVFTDNDGNKIQFGDHSMEMYACNLEKYLSRKIERG